MFSFYKFDQKNFSLTSAFLTVCLVVVNSRSVLASSITPGQKSEASLCSMIYSQALALYSAGELEKSYPLFEEVFTYRDHLRSHILSASQSPDPNLVRNSALNASLNASMILAYAPSSLLAKNKRQDYALYYLEHASQIPKKTKSGLHRVIGDGFFDSHLFDQATQYYQLLASEEGDLLNQAYGKYRLGWVDLNRQQPDRAFFRWADFLNESGVELQKQDQDMFKSLVRDLGRAWAESVEVLVLQEQKKDFFSFIPKFPEFVSSHRDFSEGIVLGLKRYAREDLVQEFKKQLSETPYFEEVFNGLLEKGAVFKNFPCQIIYWLPLMQNQPSESTPPRGSLPLSENLFLIFNACAKKIVDQNLCQKPESMEFEYFFDQIDLKGDQLLPRVSLSVSCKRWMPACKDLLQLAIQNAQSKNERLPKESMQPLTESCLNGIENKDPTSFLLLGDQVKSDYQTLLNLYAEKSLYDKENEDPIFSLIPELIQDPHFKRKLLEGLFTPLGSQVYVKTKIPEILMEVLTPSEQLTQGESLLRLVRNGRNDLASESASSGSEFHPSNAWLNLFKKLFQSRLMHKEFSSAFALLVEFFPMGTPIAQNEELSKLWEFFWLELPPEESLGQIPLIDVWFHSLPISQLKDERKLRALAIGIKFDQIQSIWNQRQWLLPSLKAKPEWKVEFFQKTLNLLKAGSFEKEKLRGVPEGELLLRLSEDDPTLSAGEVRFLLGDGNSVSNDFQVLDRLRKLSANLIWPKLKLSGALPRVLKNKIEILNKEHRLVFTTSWINAKYLQNAKDLFVGDSQKIISQIEGVKKAASHNPELNDLVQQLGEIIQNIKEKQNE